MAQGHLLADDLAEFFDLRGPEGRECEPTVTERPARRGIGPCGWCESMRSLRIGFRGGGIIADVLARQDALDGLLDRPDGRDDAFVEGARPGVGQQDLRLERQAVKRMGRATIEHLGAAKLFLELAQGAIELGRLGGAGLAHPAADTAENPHSSFPRSDVPQEDFAR